MTTPDSASPAAGAGTAVPLAKLAAERVIKTLTIESVDVVVVQRGNQTIYKLANNAAVSTLPPQTRQLVIARLKELHQGTSTPTQTPPVGSPAPTPTPPPASTSLAAILSSLVVDKKVRPKQTATPIAPAPPTGISKELAAVKNAIMQCTDPAELKQLQAAQAVLTGVPVPGAPASPLGAKTTARTSGPHRLKGAPTTGPKRPGDGNVSPLIRRRVPYPRVSPSIAARKLPAALAAAGKMAASSSTTATAAKRPAPASATTTSPDATYWRQTTPLTTLTSQLVVSAAPGESGMPKDPVSRLLTLRRQHRSGLRAKAKSSSVAERKAAGKRATGSWIPTRAEADLRDATVKRIRQAYTQDLSRALAPDTETPFSSVTDAYERLVPFHVYQYPDHDLVPAADPDYEPSKYEKPARLLKNVTKAQGLMQRYRNLLRTGTPEPAPIVASEVVHVPLPSKWSSEGLPATVDRRLDWIETSPSSTELLLARRLVLESMKTDAAQSPPPPPSET
ncbi:hypothetical protein IWQ60_007746 [Tieghemiomyces parasiticus]|uniref:GLTSCR protein conserved domain-containing protein n=1 Tax=Tieghemiomyces parasiticus TaxID=78921 RepID=A0A9W8A513_9FUNG|nr:hypothetical protein IWQ60_007746 [Tieghemiomyces parasiticus]